MSNVEDQLKQTSAQLSMAKDSNLELEAEVNKVQLTADQAQRTAEDMERRLSRRAGELQASEEKCAQLERRIGNVFLAWYFRQSGKLISYFATLVKVWKSASSGNPCNALDFNIVMVKSSRKILWKIRKVMKNKLFVNIVGYRMFLLQLEQSSFSPFPVRFPSLRSRIFLLVCTRPGNSVFEKLCIW